MPDKTIPSPKMAGLSMAQSAAVLWHALQGFTPPQDKVISDRIATVDTPDGRSRMSFYIRSDLVCLRIWNDDYQDDGPSPFYHVSVCFSELTGIPLNRIEEGDERDTDAMFTLKLNAPNLPPLLALDYARHRKDRSSMQARRPSLLSNHQVLQLRRVIFALDKTVGSHAEKMRLPRPRVYDPFAATS